ncbi:MAG: macro domain-containing protein [Actinomycetota bacterium]|nr:macro domain-containing protein [Actinomycetota bacterium]
MITAVKKGNLLESRAQTLVNTVNTVGVMGKGIALEFKKRFPDMFKDYEARCEAGLVRLGEPYLYRTLLPPWIINFPTKGHWRAVSRLSDIERGLEDLAKHLEEWGVESLAVPPLGCGHGQLEWALVGPAIYRHLDQLPLPVELYAPHDVPDEQATIDFLVAGVARGTEPKNSFVKPAWVAIAEAVRSINDEPFGWPIGRTRFQKLVYFATAAGIDTGVTFSEGSYGPFSDELKRILTKLVNNGVLTETRRGQLLQLRPGPTFGDAKVQFGSTVDKYDSAITRVADLMGRLDTSRTEVAASVHFAANALASQLGRRPTEGEVLERVLRWKQRRRPPLGAASVATAIRDLAMLGWMDVEPSEDLPVPDDVLTVA